MNQVGEHVSRVGFRARGESIRPAFFVVTIFASAFLVFLVQPMVGKLLLPLLGGSPAVWNTSMAFFQGCLLLGYGYAHWLQRFPLRRQATLHTAMLVIAVVELPLRVRRVFVLRHPVSPCSPEALAKAGSAWPPCAGSDRAPCSP